MKPAGWDIGRLKPRRTRYMRNIVHELRENLPSLVAGHRHYPERTSHEIDAVNRLGFAPWYRSEYRPVVRLDEGERRWQETWRFPR